MAVGDKIAAWSGAALDFGSSHVPIDPGSLQASPGHVWEELMSAGALTPDLALNRGKRVEIGATLLDPSLITAWTAYGSGQTYTSIAAAWRAYGDRTAGYSTTYKKLTSAQGVILPVSLSGGPERAARLAVRILPLFSAGVMFTEAATSLTAPTVAAAYYPTSLTIGGAAITELGDLQVNWDYGQPRFVLNNSYEPETCYADTYRLAGSAVVGDLDDVTLARLEDGASATVVALFTDAVGGALTVSVNLGTCRLQAGMRDGQGVIEFSQVV
jgi:hypothetical protein